MWLVKWRQKENGNPENYFTHTHWTFSIPEWGGFSLVHEFPLFFFVHCCFFFFLIPNSLYKKGCYFLFFLALKHLLSLPIDLPGQKREGILQACLNFAILSQDAILIHSKRNTGSGEGKEPVLICQEDLCLFEKQQPAPHIIKISSFMWKICKVKQKNIFFWVYCLEIVIAKAQGFSF